MKKSRSFIVAVTLCALIVQAVLLFYLSAALFSYLHVRKLAKDLGNPIVDNHYCGWHKTLLDENIEIRIPDDWILVNDGTRVTISKNTGGTIAIGLRGTKKQADELLYAYWGNQMNSYETERFNYNSLGSLAYTWWTVCDFGNQGVKKIVSLSLPYYYNNEDYVYYIFFTDEGTLRCDEAEAIAFSMSYK